MAALIGSLCADAPAIKACHSKGNSSAQEVSAHPVAVVEVEDAVDDADARAVNVTADYAVRSLPPRLSRQRMLVPVNHLRRKL